MPTGEESSKSAAVGVDLPKGDGGAIRGDNAKAQAFGVGGKLRPIGKSIDGNQLVRLTSVPLCQEEVMA